ncbi:MAG: Holliday junction resolvase RuvX [Bacilli bacterium]|nr:Holliday junction resolvase RuvX [Bacilli bacterium]
MRYLGLDLGSRTLGVAVSDATGTVANSVKIIRHHEDYDALVGEVCDLVREYDAKEIVLGFPKNMNGTIGFKGELSIDFKEKLEEALSIPVVLQDERLTTKSATDLLITGGVSRKKRKEVIDAVAATIILQSYLDRREEK